MARYDNNFEQDDDRRGGRYGDQDSPRRASGEHGRRRGRDGSDEQDGRWDNGEQRRQPLAGLSSSRSNPYEDEDRRRSGGGQDEDRGGYGGRGEDWGRRQDAGNGRPGGDDEFDPDYRRWREEQVRTFDEDYKAFRTERAKKFGTDFNEFRQGRERTAQKASANTRKGAQNSETQN
jgi:hypothetical protein